MSLRISRSTRASSIRPFAQKRGFRRALRRTLVEDGHERAPHATGIDGFEQTHAPAIVDDRFDRLDHCLFLKRCVVLRSA
jgi:hypothetical protein